jgi:hypothetical protein
MPKTLSLHLPISLMSLSYRETNRCSATVVRLEDRTIAPANSLAGLENNRERGRMRTIRSMSAKLDCVYFERGQGHRQHSFSWGTLS